MANSVTIHSIVGGDTFALTLQKTGTATGHAQLQQENPPGPSYAADLSAVHSDSTGTQLSCEASAFGYSVPATCSVASGPPDGPSVRVVSHGVVPINNTYAISQSDAAALTDFIKANYHV